MMCPLKHETPGYDALMYTAELTVLFEKANQCEAVSDALTELLACWYKNGQISLTPSAFAQSGDQEIKAFVMLPEAESLNPKWHSIYVRNALTRLCALDGSVSIKVLGRDPQASDSCHCAKRTCLVMYTHYLSAESPVRCGTCFLPVALYHLPCTRDYEYFDWRSWEVNYRACDALQMQCTVGERYHERQLHDPSSDLNRSGLALRDAVCQLIKIPVFYLLHRTRGRSKASERKRCCPSCGAVWLLAHRWHVFDFRCDACMLASNIAASVR
jgi:predicted  nucleic acid-binding Zn ribbon protein